MLSSGLARPLLLGPLLTVLGGCPAAAAPGRPIETCQAACVEQIGKVCNEAECGRGCELILDRIVEREAPGILRCVGRSRRRCSDVAWAECAALVGPHEDGGPPALPPPEEFE